MKRNKRPTTRLGRIRARMQRLQGKMEDNQVKYFGIPICLAAANEPLLQQWQNLKAKLEEKTHA